MEFSFFFHFVWDYGGLRRNRPIARVTFPSFLSLELSTTRLPREARLRCAIRAPSTVPGDRNLEERGLCQAPKRPSGAF